MWTAKCIGDVEVIDDVPKKYAADCVDDRALGMEAMREAQLVPVVLTDKLLDGAKQPLLRAVQS